MDRQQAFARIAADETRHAALSFSVARWSSSLLSDRARRRVANAQARAYRTLRADVEASWSAHAGRPPRPTALALLDALQASASIA